MDPFTMTLAGQAVAALIPLVKKGAEALANELGSKLGDDVAKATVDKVRGLFSRIKAKLSRDGKAVDALRHFEEEPDRYASALQDILKQKLDQDKDFSIELDGLVRKLNLNVIIKITEGKNVTGIKSKEMKGGTANVSMDIGKGENIKGADIDSIG